MKSKKLYNKTYLKQTKVLKRSQRNKLQIIMLKNTITMEVEKNETTEEHKQMCSQEQKTNTQSKECFNLKL